MFVPISMGGAEERDVCAHGMPPTNIFLVKFSGDQKYQYFGKS